MTPLVPASPGQRSAGADTGSASVYVLAGLALVGLLASALLAVVVAIGARHRAEAAADLAALAGASAHQRGSDACTEARVVASANGAVLVACHVDPGGDVAVAVTVRLPALLAGRGLSPAGASARAGPAGG